MLLRLTTHAAAAYQPGLVRALRSVPRKLPPRASVGMTNGLDIFGRQPRKAPPTGVDGVDAADEETDRSEPVVKVYTVHSAVSPHLPWTSKAQEESTGSGFTIECQYDPEREGSYVLKYRLHTRARDGAR